MMKNLTLALLCCTTFLYACDDSKDTSSTMDAAENTATEAVTEADELRETSTAVVAKTSDDNQAESIYKSKCVACHGTGAAGAPKLGDITAWGTRIAQGDAVLLKNAIEGYKGDKGYMPPKGGYLSLTDEEIAITVQYMVSQSQ